MRFSLTKLPRYSSQERALRRRRLDRLEHRLGAAHARKHVAQLAARRSRGVERQLADELLHLLALGVASLGPRRPREQREHYEQRSASAFMPRAARAPGGAGRSSRADCAARPYRRPMYSVADAQDGAARRGQRARRARRRSRAGLRRRALDAARGELEAERAPRALHRVGPRHAAQRPGEQQQRSSRRAR